MAINNKQVKFTRERLANHFLKRDSVFHLLYGIFRFFVIIVENIYCVSSYLVLSWILLLPISWFRNDIYSKAENFLYNSLLFIVSSWSLAAGQTIVETGDNYKHLIDAGSSEIVNCELKYDVSTTSSKQNSRADALHGNSENSNAVNKQKSDTDHKKSLNHNQSGDAMSPNEPKDNLTNTNDNTAAPSCLKTVNNNHCNSNYNSPAKPLQSLKSNHLTEKLSDQLSTIGKGQPKKPRILLICNHISTADVPLMMQSLSTLMNQSILWVLDAQFKLTNFGLCCSSHGDFFIAKNSFTEGSLRDQVLKYPDRNLLVLFPEGGFFRKRIDGSNRYAIRNGLPLTKYVTHPRFGAFKDLIDPSVEVTHIVDATLLYDDLKNPLSILNIALGNRKEAALLHYKVYERSEINPTEEWLRNIWLEKDKLLQQYYEDRSKFYERFEGTMRSAKLDWLKVFAVHLFYLLVCYLTIYRLTIKLRP